MPPKIFYSWQSDGDGKLNHYFIRDALKEAIEAIGNDLGLDEADRPELDHDRKDVPGTPDLFATILKKIDAAAVFIADVTLTGATVDGKKKSPNANVGIELGYAFRSVGNERVLLVMNTAFGPPGELPFDLRHKSFPIQYSLAPDNAETRTDVRKKLTADLRHAISEILKHTSGPAMAVQNLPESKPTTYSPAVYFAESEALVERNGPSGTIQYVVRDHPLYFLRLIPTVRLPLLTSLNALELMIAEPQLVPFGRHSGWGNDRNRYGAICFDFTKAESQVVPLNCFSQLLLNRELWGVDCSALRNFDFMQQKAQEPRYVPASYIEEIGVTGLGNFQHIARERLGYSGSARMIIGLSNVEGFAITTGSNRIGGRLFQREVVYDTTLPNLTSDPRRILDTFFNEVWEQCGLKRPAHRG